MSGFKRFCMGVFSLVGLFATAACALTIFGPWRDQAMTLFVINEYARAVEVCLIVLAVGLLVMLLRAIFSRQVKVVQISTVDGGTISVTRDAIAAQATHIVEKDGTCSADKVRVKAKKRGNVRVYVRVLPHATVDVVAKGSQLHADLEEGLRAVCGDKVRDVSLEFVEPEAVTTAIVTPEAAGAYEEASQQVDEAYAVAEPESSTDATPTHDRSSEITVSMAGMSQRQPAPAEDEPTEEELPEVDEADLADAADQPVADAFGEAKVASDADAGDDEPTTSDEEA